MKHYFRHPRRSTTNFILRATMMYILIRSTDVNTVLIRRNKIYIQYNLIILHNNKIKSANSSIMLTVVIPVEK